MAPFAQKRMLAPLNVTGRPSEYREEYCDLVRLKMGEGLSLTAFAGFIGVSRETVYRWMSAHGAFRDAVARAKPGRQLWLELKLLHSRRGGEVAAAQFALKNAAPEDWKDMRSVEHQHTHEIRQLTDAQLHAIAAGAGVDEGGGITIDHEPQQPEER